MIGVLGQGGMGRVLLGTGANGQSVAIKQIHADLAADEGFRARFRREVEASRKVSGACTAAVLAADADAPMPWLASVFVAGPSLGAAVERSGTLPTETVRRLAVQLATALDEIHRTGLIHRDLKPENALPRRCTTSSTPSPSSAPYRRSCAAWSRGAWRRTRRAARRPRSSSARSARRRRGPVAVAAAVALCVLGAGAWWTLRDEGPADRPPDLYVTMPVCADVAGRLPLPAAERRTDRDSYTEYSERADSGCAWFPRDETSGDGWGSYAHAAVSWNLRRSAGTDENATEAQKAAVAVMSRA